MALDAAEPTSRKRILSWAMWDWGTQPFSTVIVTFVFSVYLTSEGFGDVNTTSQAVNIGTAAAGILVALLAPAMGQNSDRHGHTVRDLRFLTYGLVILAASLYAVQPKPSFLALGVVLFSIGFVVNEIAQVGNNALLDEVASGANVGKVSGFGWGMGYLGGIVSLLLLNFAFIDDNSWTGISHDNGLSIRVTMLGCAVWILLFTIPTFRNLSDRAPSAQATEPNPFFAGRTGWAWGRVGAVCYTYRELWRSIVRLWHENRPTAIFVAASCLFRDGLNSIFTVGGMVAAGTFGFSAGDVIMFGAIANVTAGVSTMLFGLVDDRIGPKKVIMISLGALAGLAAVIFVGHAGGAKVFWAAGLALTLFVGPAQAASRSYLARLIPEGRSGEIFGLYATTGRAVSFLSPAAFAICISIGHAVTGEENTQYWGILGIVIVLVAGLAAMIPVREPQRAGVGSDGAGAGDEPLAQISLADR